MVNALLVGIWLVTTGSTTELAAIQDDPLQAARDGFWPVIVAAAWGGGLVIHAAGWLASLLPKGSGRQVSTQGDGFLVRFDTPDAAVACAVALHSHMGEARDGGSFVPELRVGIHAGEAMAEDNDLMGRVINLASRVTDAAAPGEILITEPVADHLSPGVALADRGLRPLKGFDRPRHLLAVMWHATDETIVLTAEMEESES